MSIFGNNLLHTNSQYAETAGGMLSFSKAGVLANTIAWAAEHNIPFDQALTTMTDCGTVRSTEDLIPYFNNFFRKEWNTSLELAILDIQNGAPLHFALRKRLSQFLPAYFLDAVEMAEKEGCLAEVMPRFAKRINFVTDIKLKIASALSFPIMELVIILIISSSLSIFIVPKFNKIFLELLGDEPTPVFLSRYSFASNWIFSHFLEIVLSFFLFLIVFRHLKPYLKIAYEEIIIRIPFLNKGVKWNALLELAGSMASYLASGKDMSEAAELSAKSAEFPWIRKKLSKFAQSVRNGDDWTQAWREMKLGSSINDWIVMNSVGRNNPAEGFDTMLIWLSNDISKASVRKIRWIEISGILFIGLFVAVTAIALMGSIFKIIGFLAETL